MADSETDTDACIFCRIVAGELPATVVHSDDDVLAIQDIAPIAPTHILVLAKQHHPDVAALAAAAPGVLARLVSVAASVAAAAGTPSHKLLFNSGPEAGQTVAHVHGHVIAGGSVSSLPG